MGPTQRITVTTPTGPVLYDICWDEDALTWKPAPARSFFRRVSATRR